MYNLVVDPLTGSLSLNNNDILVGSLGPSESIKVVILEGNKEFSKTFLSLNSFFKAFIAINDLKKVSIYFGTGSEENLIKFNSESTGYKTFKNIYNLSYQKVLSVKSPGFADYAYVNYFMPKWSVAHNFQYSNHTKAVEPLFTDLKMYSQKVKQLVSKDYLEDLNDINLEKYLNVQTFLQSNSYNISNQTLSLLDQKVYRLNSEVVLDFDRKFKTLYVKRIQNTDISIKIEGILNNTFVEETVRLYNSGLVEVKTQFEKVFNISIESLLNFDEEMAYENLSIVVTPCIVIEDLEFQFRSDGSTFYKDSNKLMYNFKSKKSVFNLGLEDQDDLQGIFIDSLDNIYMIKNSSLFKGRVDAKLNLQIPKDISYNNTKYIETTFLNPSEYLVEILLKDFLRDTDNSIVSVAVKDSSGLVYYLNSEAVLEASEEELFIDLSSFKRDTVAFELNFDSNSEFIIITLKDYANLHQKSNIIVHPKIDFKKELDLDPDEVIRVVNNKLIVLNLNDLTIKESSYE